MKYKEPTRTDKPKWMVVAFMAMCQTEKEVGLVTESEAGFRQKEWRLI
jgi:hypothetical protein